MEEDMNRIHGFNEVSKFVLKTLTESGYFINSIPDDKVIYHYTNWDLAKMVLRDGFQIHSSNSMNDSSEQSYTYGLFGNSLKSLYPEDETANWVKLSENIIKQDFLDFYIWSFSENGNSQALFGYYPAKSDAVNIGFNANNLFQSLGSTFSNEINADKGMKDEQITTQFVKCVYDKHLQDYLISTIINCFVQSYFLDDPLAKNILLDCRRSIAFCSLVFKNPIYYQEEETRIVMVQSNIHKNKLYDGTQNNRTYLNFPVNKFVDSLNCVTLRTGSDNSINEVNNYLKLNGYNQCAKNSILGY